MKKDTLIISLLAFFFVTSCEKEDKGGEMEPVGNVKASSFYGSVTLSWTVPQNEDYYYTLVSYVDTEGKKMNRRISCYDSVEGVTTTTLGGFTDTGTYEFSLVACGFSGATSPQVKVSGAPLGISGAKDYVMETVWAEPAEMGALLSWENVSGVAVNLVATYKDKKQRVIEKVIDAQKSGNVMLANMIETTEIQVVAHNLQDDTKTEPKRFTVTPVVDPDDIVYEGIEYLSFSGSMWDMYFSQDDPDNPNEFTVTTTGGDPYIFLNDLRSPKAGTVLKFRYKSTADIEFEIYWCDTPGGAGGGRCTMVVIPASEKWATFTYDYAGDMIFHHWAGNAGNSVRFDFGVNPDVTIHIRNIHFVAE